MCKRQLGRERRETGSTGNGLWYIDIRIGQTGHYLAYFGHLSHPSREHLESNTSPFQLQFHTCHLMDVQEKRLTSSRRSIKI